MTKFFREYKDTSKESIEKTAEFLTRKPKRQGSNQSINDIKSNEPKQNTKKK